MEATEQTTITEPKQKRKKPVRRKRAAPRAPAAAKAAAPAEHRELEGITQQECPFACNVDKCAITGINVCGHPHKCGLQSALLNNPDAVQRYQAARRIVAHQVTEKKS